MDIYDIVQWLQVTFLTPLPPPPRRSTLLKKHPLFLNKMKGGNWPLVTEKLVETLATPACTSLWALGYAPASQEWLKRSGQGSGWLVVAPPSPAYNHLTWVPAWFGQAGS